ncbi:MAG: hypothetical protein WCT04_18600 [Planctomycetota bacterium]
MPSSIRSALALLTVLASIACAGEAPTAPQGCSVSEAVSVGDATFHLVAQNSWVIPEKEPSSDIKFWLVINNTSAGPIQVNLFDTISFILVDGAGKKINCASGRDKTRVPPPIVIEKGASVTIDRPAKLEKGNTPGAYKLTGSDGAGGWWWFDGLQSGNYTISMTCSNTQKSWEHLLETPAKKSIADAKTTPFWIGSAVTKELIIDINKKVPPRP